MNDVYEQLANFFDELPAGYPRTEGGAEMRILRKLFSPEEAELCLHLTLLPEPARVVAYRAGRPEVEITSMLDEMVRKGLIYATHSPAKPPEYMAMHFVVGFWEGQVNRLDRELVEDFEAYLPHFVDYDVWKKAPQLRTIPVGESIPINTGALPYERVEKIIHSHTTFSINNCICRQEMEILGKGCSKLMEACLALGSTAHNLVEAGRGRFISQSEALAILKQAEQQGLVLQPANNQKPLYICMCCGCCCGVLRTLKLHPHPASIAQSTYFASIDENLCSGCGTCLERCPMDALSLSDGFAELDAWRCIGCGLCVVGCDTGALTLFRKPESEQRPVPKDAVAFHLQLAQARGKLGKRELVSLVVKSRKDRLLVQTKKTSDPARSKPAK
jgi:Na+-translocating ferredoxin:NAD+ oxidoreductase subunit B